ncbi:hypothetical protein GJ496_000333 [Pomphorhynchus laevis]|nr:hypothetical protein GJ496_000333 [Pomphorhynchus laevis]
MASFGGHQKVQKVMVQPINLIFRFLQNASRIQIWVYEQVQLKIEGKIIGFDEYMNLVLDDAEEINTKRNSRKKLGRILLKGDNMSNYSNPPYQYDVTFTSSGKVGLGNNHRQRLPYAPRQRALLPHPRYPNSGYYHDGFYSSQHASFPNVGCPLDILSYHTIYNAFVNNSFIDHQRNQTLPNCRFPRAPYSSNGHYKRKWETNAKRGSTSDKNKVGGNKRKRSDIDKVKDLTSESEYASDDGEELPASAATNARLNALSSVLDQTGNDKNEQDGVSEVCKRSSHRVAVGDSSNKVVSKSGWEPAELPPEDKILKMSDPKLIKSADQTSKDSNCEQVNKGNNTKSTNPNQNDVDQIKSFVTDVKCMICAVEFTSAIQRKQHIEGRKHQKRLKFFAVNGSDLIPAATVDAAESLDANKNVDLQNAEDCDVDDDVVMDDFDDHTAFEEGLGFLRSVCRSQKDQNKLTQCAFELFRMMEDYLRFLTKCYVSPGLDPRRMSWNELLNVLKRNTVNRLSSSFDRKLDSVRQLRNSVVHSFSMSLSEDGLNKIFSIADDLVLWGRGFKSAAGAGTISTDGTGPKIYEGVQQRKLQ